MTGALRERDSLRHLYPTLTETELSEAGANLRRYLEIVWEIQTERGLDAGDSKFDTSVSSRMIKERSNNSLKS
jgi:hypothetical protein